MMMGDGNASVNHDEQVISKSGSTREDWKQLWHTLHLSQSPRWSGFRQQLLLQCHIVTGTNFQFNVMKMIKKCQLWIPAEKDAAEKSCWTWSCRWVSTIWKPGEKVAQLLCAIFLFIWAKGRLDSKKWMFFWKKSKRPSTMLLRISACYVFAIWSSFARVSWTT